MSKAFTKESDDLPDRPAVPRLPSPLPPGAKNYLTADGARRLLEELDRLVQVERPLIASTDDAEARRQLHSVDQRILYLRQSLESAVIVPPPAATEERVRFGATVTVREGSGELSRYRIVGVDETDLDRNWISWLSPLAKTLTNARLGERVRLKTPLGEEELQVVNIAYEPKTGI